MNKNKYGHDLIRSKTRSVQLYVSAKHSYFDYYSLQALSIFSLAKVLQLILEISLIFRLLSYLLTDKCTYLDLDYSRYHKNLMQ